MRMRLSDYVDINPKTQLANGTQVPFIGMNAITAGCRKVVANERREAKGSGTRFLPGDTLFARITPCLENGKIAQFSDTEAGLGSTEFFVLRAKKNVSDQDFVFYFALQEELRTAAVKSMTGASGRQRADVSALKEFSCKFPPLPIQRRIAGILSAYDDLIENNQRRIRILEDMARSHYREWFVHFRYPGHESDPLVDSPLGQIPQGWEVKKLKEVCNLTMGSSPKSEFYNETGDGLPFHQGVTNFGDKFPTDRLFCTVESRIAEAGDILFSVRAPVGRMNITDKKIIIGRGLSAIHHKAGHQAFLWEQLCAKFTEEDMMGNGAIFASVTKDDMQGIELLCPAEPVIKVATRYFKLIHAEIEVLIKQSSNLRRTRDLLLPRLLSGQVELAGLSAEVLP